MTLTGYQVDAAQRIVTRIRQGAQSFTDDADRTAVSLSAPTGSGKTIIAASVIERLLFGSEDHAANKRLVVLWISDSPSLNEQTRDKFLAFSPKFTLDRLVIVGDDDPLDAASLAPGRVYFLNTQKLGAGAFSYRKGDSREFDLWQTIDGTGRIAAADFLMIVDEAHRGTGQASTSRTTQTILGQLVKGGPQLPHPAPVVLGISATPERFGALTGDMSLRPVAVDVDQVRESGLVKDQVLLAHPSESQAADATLLGAAAHARQDMAKAWRDYTDSEGLPAVEPILMVQVTAGESDVAIGRILDALFAADSSLRDEQLVHALESHKTATFGVHTVRWLEPSRIQETARVRVVVFKEAITTGWDCPRAEVLISLRGAQDDTYITQLIGRTVRTPLARRIETRDELNQVWVYLPHFDADTVQRVVGRLASGDDAIAPQIVVNPVLLQPNPDVPLAVWEVFEHFPTNTKPSKTARNNVARAIDLGMVLNSHGVAGVGKGAVQKQVTDALVSFMERDDIADSIDKKVTDFENIDFATLAVDWMTGEVIARAEGSLHVVAANIEDLFSAAKRKLPESAALWLWDRLCDIRYPDDFEAAKLTVAAVAFDAEALKVAEQTAGQLFSNWYKNYAAALVGDREAQAHVTALLAQSRVSQPATIASPDRSNISPSDQWWDRHLLVSKPGQYADVETKTMYPAGRYPWRPTNTWEQRTIEAELARPSVVAWYRNPTRGSQAVGIPYGPEEKQRLAYPDFIIFRQHTPDGPVEVDIVDPHRPDLGDTIPKWHALAEWAATVNAGGFDLEATETQLARLYRLGRVWAVIENTTGELLYVDLLDDSVRNKFAHLADQNAGEAEVRDVFSTYGAKLTVPGQ